MKARILCTFVGDRSLSKHLHTQVKESVFTLLEAFEIDVVLGAYFGIEGGIYRLYGLTNIASTIPGLCVITWYLTCQGWSFSNKKKTLLPCKHSKVWRLENFACMEASNDNTALRKSEP